MKIANSVLLEAVAGAAVICVGIYLLSKLTGVAGGVLSGDNALTQNATDSNGNRVTAYQGAGVLGTAGAAANTVSGGYLATFGTWLGGKAYDLTHSDPQLTSGDDNAVYLPVNGWQAHGAR